MRDAPQGRAAYRRFLAIPTRWMDNDSYGHVNNVTYYSYFDTAVNEHLIRDGGLDVANAPVIGVVVETGCRFHASLSFPETIDAGLVVTRLGADFKYLPHGYLLDIATRRSAATSARHLRKLLVDVHLASG